MNASQQSWFLGVFILIAMGIWCGGGLRPINGVLGDITASIDRNTAAIREPRECPAVKP
jgi:hypothetical protein